ncbi:MAG: hypothetical protein U0235_08820 [Polyangiaceae bacterium]
MSRPSVNVAVGIWKLPASLPSARSAVSVMPDAPAAAAGAAIALGAAEPRAAPPPRRNPHEPQKTLLGAFW